jgi:RNA polymerase sigma factor (sigma-70 family)
MSALAVVTRPTDQSTDDLDLVAAVRAGDDRAFELLFLRYQSRIAVYVRGMVRDHGRAEDITQEVFIAALRRMRETDREIAFKPWIYEIAKNACIDAFRRARATSEVSFDAEDALAPSDHRRLAAAGSGPEAAVDTKLTIDNLCGAFGGLSQTHHDVLVMREFEGLSYVEIGERLGMSRAAVESTLFRARRRLSEEYEELVSGERCVRVRGIVDAPAGRFVGLRDQRRMARHVSHCQPCRRYARMAGVELDGARAPASAAARIAALLPLPFLRRRVEVEEAGQLLGHHGTSVVKWSPSVVNALDPATVSGWSKAVATVATVAVAGLGAGATVGGHKSVGRFIARAPSMVGLAPEHPAVRAPSPGGSRSPAPVVTRTRGLAAANGGGRGRDHGLSAVAGGATTAAIGDPAARGDQPAPPAAPPVPASAQNGRPGSPTIGDTTKRLGAKARETTAQGLVAPRDDTPADRQAKPIKEPVGRLLGGAGATIGTAGSAVHGTAADLIGGNGLVQPGSGSGRASGAGGGVAGLGGALGGAAGVGGAGGAVGSAAAPAGASGSSGAGLDGTLSPVIGETLDVAGPGLR